MEPSLDLTAGLTLLGAAQGLLLALALLGLKKADRTATRLLAAFMLVSAISMGGSLLVSTKYIFSYPHLTQVSAPFHFLFGPIIFLYVRGATSRGSRLRKRELLHLVPFALCAAYYLPLYLQSRAGKLDYLHAAFQNYPPAEWRIRSLLLVFQFLPYLALALFMFFAHARKVQIEPAAGRLNLLWLRTFIVMILIICGAGLFRLVFDFRAETMLLVPLCFSIMVYVAGYMALRHPEALAGRNEAPPPKKYEKSTLTPERAEAYLKKLLHVMETESLYRDGDLTLQKLSERLSIPINHLSQIINERLGQTFIDFISSYRVKEAQKMLADPAKKHYTVIAIAEEVGFNSKSAFNAVFKKQVNMTPSEYRKSASSKG
ncbi:MAG TPA: helix-turn-helix transcriptional regulator [Blastocatellia bacterium]|nr:helix-turn-helix transcriptional regulator [Blastocatellia bacterium]